MEIKGQKLQNLDGVTAISVFTPCKHNLCEKCGGKTKKHPWEDRLWLSALNCDCKGWIKLHPESQEHPNNK